jgi:hypothetical protein
MRFSNVWLYSLNDAMLRRATPLSIAACATADDTWMSNRLSPGLGRMYSLPKVKLLPYCSSISLLAGCCAMAAIAFAAAKAIAAIAREPASGEIEEQYGRTFTFGHEYILPKPGDRRLLTEVSSAVARAAMESGVARRSIASFEEYGRTLLSRIDSNNFFAREYVRHTMGRHRIEKER